MKMVNALCPSLYALNLIAHNKVKQAISDAVRNNNTNSYNNNNTHLYTDIKP